MKQKGLFIPYIPIIIGTVTAEIYIFYAYGGRIDMNEVSVVALIVAVLGAASGIWAQVVQFKKDAKRIDDVNSNVGGVKADTSELKPKVTTTDENVKKIRDEVVEKVVPAIGKLNGVDTLVEAYKIEKAIKENNSPNLYDRDVLKGTIDLVYEENAKLREEIHGHLKQLHLYKLENNRLKAQVSSLEEELNLYQEPENEQTYETELELGP